MSDQYKNLVAITSKTPFWGWSQDTLLEQLAAYHKQAHGDEGETAWTASINGMYVSLCGLKCDMLTALRHAGACRN